MKRSVVCDDTSNFIGCFPESAGAKPVERALVNLRRHYVGLDSFAAEYLIVELSPYLVLAGSSIGRSLHYYREVALAHHLICEDLSGVDPFDIVLPYFPFVQIVIHSKSALHIDLNIVVGTKIAPTNSILVVCGQDYAVHESLVLGLINSQ